MFGEKGKAKVSHYSCSDEEDDGWSSKDFFEGAWLDLDGEPGAGCNGSWVEDGEFIIDNNSHSFKDQVVNFEYSKRVQTYRKWGDYTTNESFSRTLVGYLLDLRDYTGLDYVTDVEPLLMLLPPSSSD